jgi:hypothetical protein
VTVRDNILPILDNARGIVANLGLRRYSVTIRRRTWSGSKPGLGIATNDDLVLTPTPRVRLVSAREIASSGGTYQEGDFRIDRITPRFTSPTVGGYTPEQIKPAITDPADDLVVVLAGDEQLVKICTHVGPVAFDRAFGYSQVVRQKRETPR